MNNIIRVGMADLKASKHPCMITTLGLGSCIGIALYDSALKISGLAHIMLPYSNFIKNNSNIAKFADTGIKKLFSDMVNMGSKKRNLTARIAGGAQMFKFSQMSEIMKVGLRNAEASRKILEELEIPLLAEDVGGSYGRTVELYSSDGKFVIKTIGHGIKDI
ncbi:MAG: chemotaxis protein CheD [Clostridiales bacterium]